jgi:hypothetical protein
LLHDRLAVEEGNALAQDAGREAGLGGSPVEVLMVGVVIVPGERAIEVEVPV